MKPAHGLLIGLGLFLNGCTHKPPRPAPPAARPVVARRTLTLRRPADLDAHGDVVIPRIAIVRRGGIPSVFVLSKHGRARLRLIKIGATTAHRAEILSGLNGDETLVLPPFRGVFDGSPIHPIAQP